MYVCQGKVRCLSRWKNDFFTFRVKVDSKRLDGDLQVEYVEEGNTFDTDW